MWAGGRSGAPPGHQRLTGTNPCIHNKRPSWQVQLAAHTPCRSHVQHYTQTTSGAAATSERLHQETELAIKQVQADVKASKGGVVDMLLKYATTVEVSK